MYTDTKTLPVSEDVDVLVCGAGLRGEADGLRKWLPHRDGHGAGCAGVAAALAARARIAPASIAVPALQHHLREQGALLD